MMFPYISCACRWFTCGVTRLAQVWQASIRSRQGVILFSLQATYFTTNLCQFYADLIKINKNNKNKTK